MLFRFFVPGAPQLSTPFNASTRPGGLPTGWYWWGPQYCSQWTGDMLRVGRSDNILCCLKYPIQCSPSAFLHSALLFCLHAVTDSHFILRCVIRDDVVKERILKFRFEATASATPLRWQDESLCFRQLLLIKHNSPRPTHLLLAKENYLFCSVPKNLSARTSCCSPQGGWQWSRTDWNKHSNRSLYRAFVQRVSPGAIWTLASFSAFPERRRCHHVAFLLHVRQWTSLYSPFPRVQDCFQT